MTDISDSLLSDCLLKDVTLYHHNKVLREGKLLLFCIKDFHLHFTFSIKNQTKHFDIPYPFEIKKIANNLILLEFTLSSFKAEFEDIERRVKNIGCKKKSRYYNSIIRVSSN
jgi:hypothetical protein